MKTTAQGKVVFKPYQPHQATFLPPSLEELIPHDHLVRVVSASIDRMRIEPLLEPYKGGGTSAYHPKMLLKVLVYAYTQRIYSSRQIAKAIRENIHFMWLSGGNRPDFRTINRFRGSRLRQTIDEVFVSLMELFVEEGLLRLDAAFLDGTKLEANANRYSYVWKKSMEHHRRQLRRKIAAVLAEIEDAEIQEHAAYGDRDLEELGEASTLTPARLGEKVAELDRRLAEAAQDSAAQDASRAAEPPPKALRRARKQLAEAKERLERYEEQERLLDGRNSYSKTDPDATFMRTKDDHLRTGQLKPAYNVQLTTEGQIILCYSVHQNAADWTLLMPHIEKLARLWGRAPEVLVADAGYGSEQNYAFAEERGIAAYVKYPTFRREQTRRYQEDPFEAARWPYDAETDSYLCPAGERLVYEKTVETETSNGYRSERRLYTTAACASCSLRARCLRGAGNRTLTRGRIEAYRRRARERLLSEEGRLLRARRGIEVESVFGQIKQSRGYRRFLLRGLDKVNVECGLLAMAHNLIKWWNLLEQAQSATPDAKWATCRV